MNVTFTIDKQEVLTEIAKTTSYIGAKKEGDDGTAYDRIYTTDEDAEMLERYWQETEDTLATSLHCFVSAQSETTGGKYSITLGLPDNWNKAMQKNLQQDIFSLFVQSIIAKWHMLTNKAEVEAYAALAAGTLSNIDKALLKRVRPTRPTTTTDDYPDDGDGDEDDNDTNDEGDDTDQGTTNEND